MLADAALALALLQAPDVCTGPPSGTFTVTAAAPFTVGWVMDATVPVSDVDQIQVPQRINGFFVQIDNGPKQNIGLPPAGAVCPTGTVQQGKIPYNYRAQFGGAKGPHTLLVSGWNFKLDASGNPTTVVEGGPVVSIPFSAVDPVRFGPPTAPIVTIIKR